jgi:hypothetical protein
MSDENKTPEKHELGGSNGEKPTEVDVSISEDREKSVDIQGNLEEKANQPPTKEEQNISTAEGQPEIGSSEGQSDNLDDQDQPQATPPPEENWEDALNERLTEAEIKKRKKEEKNKKRIEKQRVMQAKTQELMEKQFSKVFDPKVAFYTVAFMVAAIVIPLMWFFLNSEEHNVQFYQINVIISVIVGFFILLQISRNKSIGNALFLPRKVDLLKIILFIASGMLGFGLCYLFWKYLDPEITEELKYFQFQALFEVILAVIFWGWNIIQIWFLKTSLENASINVEARFQVNMELKTQKDLNRRAKLIDYGILFVPIFIHILFLILYLTYDTAEPYENFYATFGQEIPDYIQELIYYKVTLPSGEIIYVENGGDYIAAGYLVQRPSLVAKFTPDVFYFAEYLAVHYPDASLTSGEKFGIFFEQYLPQVWFANPALKAVFIWATVAFIVIFLTIYRQVGLYRKSFENKTPNIFSGFFFLLFWIILYIKFFLIIKIYLSTLEEVAVNLQWYDELFNYVTSILLMLLTIVNMLRGFGLKIRKIHTEKPWINEFNMTFILFMLILSYWGGQWTIISGGDFLNKQSLDMAVNIVVVIVNVSFYYWYSNWVLERKGFIRKSNYTVVETRQLLIELSQNIKENMLQTIENREIIVSTLNEFMLEKKIALEEGGKEEDRVVETLEEQEEELSPRERLERVQDAFKGASIERNAYEAAVSKIASLEQQLQGLKDKQSIAQTAVEGIATDIDDRYSVINQKKQDIEGQLSARRNELAHLKTNPSPTLEILKNITDIQAVLEQKTNELVALKPDWTTTKAEYDDAQAKRQVLIDLNLNIAETIREFDAINSDLVTLKERAEAAQPTLDAASLALQSAETEKSTHEALVQAVEIEKMENEKLTKALNMYDRASNDLRAAETLLGTMKTQDEIRTDIATAETKIAQFNQDLTSAQQILEERKQILAEKDKVLNTAKQEYDAAETNLEPYEKGLSDAKIGLENSIVALKRGKTLKIDLENSQRDLAQAQVRQKKGPDYNQNDQKLHEVQASLKDARNRLKDLKKQDPGDGSTMQEINDMIAKVNQLEGDETHYKGLIKDAKTLLDLVDDNQKRVNKLKEQQVDFDEIQKQITSAEELVKKCEEDVKEPRMLLENCKKELETAQSEYNNANAEVVNSEKAVLLIKADLSNAQKEWDIAEAALNNRIKTEESLKNAQTAIADRERIVSKAKDNSKKFEILKIEAEKEFKQKENIAKLDWNIYNAHLNLKKAHKTFKDAIRSAEANVKACESLVEQAIKAKNDALSPSEVESEETGSLNGKVNKDDQPNVP